MARREPRRMPAVERAATSLGAAIVLATLGILGFQALQDGPEEPALTVTVLQVRETGATFVVDVEVRNDSRNAAADVHVAAADRTAAGEQLQAQAALAYVPGFSRRRASLVLQSDPGQNPMISIIGYTRP
jgi:uncharacterized protein (TIGR02588 family)